MRRYIWLVFLVIFALLSSGLALAQDDTQDVFCGSLSEADCVLMTRADNFDLTSAAVDVNMDMTATVNQEAIALNLTASGAFIVDPSMMPDMAVQPPMTALEQIKTAVEVMRGFDGELSVTITLPEEARAELPPGVEAITLEIKLVDGVGYVNMDTLAPLMGTSGRGQQGMQGWVGLDIVGLLDTLLEEQPELFETMNMMTPTFNPDMIERFQEGGDFNQYVSIRRTSADDAAVAVFETIIDFGSMAEDPAFAELMQTMMEAQFQAQPGMTTRERQQAMALSQALVKNMNIVVTQSVDRETAGPVSFDMMMTMDGSGLPAGSGVDSMMVEVNMNVTFDQVNAVESIAAPEDANVIPTESILSMFESMSNDN